jgi:hypothetical protein
VSGFFLAVSRCSSLSRIGHKKNRRKLISGAINNDDAKDERQRRIPGLNAFLEKIRLCFNLDQFKLNMRSALTDILSSLHDVDHHPHHHEEEDRRRKDEREEEEEEEDSLFITAPRFEKIMDDLQNCFETRLKKEVEKIRTKSSHHHDFAVDFNRIMSQFKAQFDDMCNLVAEDIVTSHSKKLNLAKARGSHTVFLTRDFREEVRNILLLHRLPQ